MSNIKELIDKFFDGTTTIEEEQELRRILCEEELPAEIEEQKPMLLAMLPTECEIPEGLEARISALIDNLAKQESTTLRDTKEAPGDNGKIRKIPLLARYAAIAAAAIALVFLLHPQEQRPQDTFSTPEEAARHINETFAHLAMVINSGQERSINTASHLQNVGTTIKNNLLSN